MDKNKFYTKLLQNYLPFILSGLLICAVLLSTSTLIVKYKLGILDLLFINTCIVGEIIAIFALLLRNKHLAGLSIPLLLWFGIGGRLNFSGRWFFPMHLTHVLMVLVSIYLVYFVWKVIKEKKKNFWIGFGIGIFLLLFLLFMMGWYYSTHPEAYKILLDVGWHGPEFR
jgi:tryptophan-rich sensory protein